MVIKAKVTLLALLMVFVFGCSKQDKSVKPVVLQEAFQTERNDTANVDSPAFWAGANGERWIITTAKKGDQLFVNDAENGHLIKMAGKMGSGPGELLRPNGIFVIDNYAIVVERDNHRVQVFDLPDFNSVLIFGDDKLVKPYGIFVYKPDSSTYRVYVTDNYETASGDVPADSLLGKRVHIFDIHSGDAKLTSTYEKAFGATSGPGTLRIVESIWGDVENNKLLIAEEDVTQSSVKVYDLDGNFTGTVFGKGIFKTQVEGIAIYKNNNAGYWFVTDQSKTDNRYVVFDRNSFEYLGAFAGKNTSNTDGIWLTKVQMTGFTKGAFYALNNDGNVSAFDLKSIADSLKLNLE